MTCILSSDAGAAFAAYLSVRHRLPQAVFAGTWEAAPTLEAISDPYDLILFDAYGVLNVGETPISGAAQRIAALRAAGKAVAVVSNSAGYPKSRMLERYSRLGFDFHSSEIVTSRETLLAHLADAPRRRWGMMLATNNGTEEFEDIEVCFLADSYDDYVSAEGFLLIGSDGWSEKRQAMLEASLRDRPRPVWVGNPDIVAPRENTLSCEPGHFAHRLTDATGAEPRFFGKPFPEIYEIALARHEPKPAPGRVLMVGDTLHTDILGGRGMGFATALVTDHGLLSGLDPAEAIRRSGIVPDFVINQI